MKHTPPLKGVAHYPIPVLETVKAIVAGIRTSRNRINATKGVFQPMEACPRYRGAQVSLGRFSGWPQAGPIPTKADTPPSTRDSSGCTSHPVVPIRVPDALEALSIATLSLPTTQPRRLCLVGPTGLWQTRAHEALPKSLQWRSAVMEESSVFPFGYATRPVH